MSSKGAWLRKAGVGEAFCNEIYKDGWFVISYVLRVGTKRPLTQQDCQKIFLSLHRKSPNLRVMIDDKDGEVWARNIDHENIDFKVLQNSDPYKVYHDMAMHRFSENGPFWAARFIPTCPEQDNFIRSTKMTADEQFSQTHPHVSHFVLCYNHAITDGFTCHQIIRNILSLIDDVIEGNPIDDTVQFGEFVDPKYENKIYEDFGKKFKADPKFLAERLATYKRSVGDTLIQEVFPRQPETIPEGKCIQWVIGEEISKKFVARCKKEGLTVHSGFTALLNAAVIKVLQEKGLKKDVYEMFGLHAVNQRKYYANSEAAFGCAMGVMGVRCDASNDILQNFWQYAKEYHKTFKDQQEKMATLEHHPLEQVTGEHPVNFLDQGKIYAKLPKIHYYCTSNMLDVTKTFGEVKKNSVLIYYDRQTDLRFFPILWMSTFQSLRGQLMHSFQYGIHSLGHEAAQKLSETIKKLVFTLAE